LVLRANFYLLIVVNFIEYPTELEGDY